MPSRDVLIAQRRRDESLKLERLRHAVEVGRRDAEAGRTVHIEAGRTSDFLAGLGQSRWSRTKE